MTLNMNEFKNSIADEVKALLKLPDGSKIDVKFTADSDAPDTSGEIQIKFAMPLKKRLTGAQVPSQKNTAGLDDDALLMLSALRDAHEKMKRPFISLTWFRDKYLPALGIKLNKEEWQAILLQLIASGDLVVDKIVDRFTGREVAAVRTPDMPPAYDPKSA